MTRLLLKTRVRERHRRILPYLHKYVITTDDIMGWSPRQADVVQPEAETDSELEEQRRQMIEFMLEGFDAEGDELDRRIY